MTVGLAHSVRSPTTDSSFPSSFPGAIGLGLVRFLVVSFLLIGCAAPSTTPTPTIPATTLPATAVVQPSPTPLPRATAVVASTASPSPPAVAVVATPPPVVVGATPSTTVAAPPAIANDWPTYHRDNARSGVDPSVTTFAAPRQLWQSDGLDGDSYAEPLVVGGRVLVATTNNTLYSLDAAGGQIVWQAHLGEPVNRSQLPCGDIPITGITGTPVVDIGRGLVYVVTYVQPTRHELVALDLATGAVRFRQPIDPPGIDVSAHQQRSALIESQNQIYIGIGGLWGDCGDYHGWVVAASADDGSVKARYEVPTQREGAIWAPSGLAVDSAGNVYAATGNGSSTSADRFDFGDALLRLSPDLKLADWFAPSNWVDLNRSDADIGSVGPALLDNGIIFQIGKSGVGYLLHADQLRHVNGQAFQAPVCGSAFGGTAYRSPTLYVPCSDGLVALRVQGESFATQWTAPGFFAGPPIVAGGAVWTIGRSGTLFGLDPATGKPLAQLAVGLPTHFATASASGGRLFVPAAKRILALSLG